jgi:hypothetical protein
VRDPSSSLRVRALGPVSGRSKSPSDENRNDFGPALGQKTSSRNGTARWRVETPRSRDLARSARAPRRG